MLKNMVKQYCKGSKKKVKVLKGKPKQKGKTIKFTDGTELFVCARARAVFYATLRKNRWDDTKPRPRVTSETVEWFLRQKGLKT